MDIVKKILKDGFWPRYCLEDLSWYIHNVDYVAFPMVCFCDIPLSRIRNHVNFYGEYGIGVTKSWAIKNKLNPVSYLSNASNYGAAINNLYQNVDFIGGTVYYKNSNNDLNTMLSHFKPLSGKMVVGGESIDKEFYQESEWRYVPQGAELKPWILRDAFLDQKELDTLNLQTKQEFSLKLSPQDIKYIFVKQDSDIPEIINFIQANLDHISNADLKILMSRVVSLESINNDL